MTDSNSRAPKIFLIGASGSGKTYSIRTLLDAGVTPFVLSLDVQGLEVLADTAPDKLHWHAIAPTGKSWSTMIEDSKRLINFDYDAVAKTKDPFKGSRQTRFIQVLETLAKFKDDRTGADFGEVDSWGTDRAIVIDHLTELGQASKEWAVGDKLILHEGEWQVAQNNLENLIRQLTIVCKCWVIMIGHIDREVDLIRGGTRIMAHALGRKLAPKLPAYFSDVILAEREETDFKWSTAAMDTDLKTRNLPVSSKIRPSFVEIANAWRARSK